MATTINGVDYPSVSQILGQLEKPALIGWAARMATEYIQDHLEELKGYILENDSHRIEDIMERAKTAHTRKKDAAADAGTLCHKAVEAFIDGGDPYSLLVDNEEAKTGYKAFLQWYDDNKVEFLESEVQVVSLLYGYAGRFDAIAMVNGKRVLIDFKTSSGIYPEMEIQLCAYRQAYNEMLPEGVEAIEDMALLHLDKKTGEPTYKKVSKDIMRKTDFFNSLCRTFYLHKKRRLKNNPFVDYDPEVAF